MNILILSNKAPLPPKDGGSIASLALAKGLVLEGHIVTMLPMNTTKHFMPLDEVNKHNLPENLLILPISVDTRIRLLPLLTNLLFSNQPYNGVRFISRKYRDALTNILLNNTFDLIILENLYTIYYSSLIRKLSKAPLVQRSHNVEHLIWQRNAESERGIRRWYTGILARRIRRLEIKAMNLCDAFVAITRQDLETFLDLGLRKPAHVLGVGLESDNNEPPIPANSMTSLAHLGALDWLPNQNGIRWFISQVWSQLYKKHPNLTFHLAGRNADESFVDSINQPGIIYHGEVENAGDFIRQHPVIIVPLFSGSGMRVKIIESMAMKRVVISTPVGAEGIEAVPGRDVLIVENAEEMAAAIELLLNSPQKIRDIGENAFTFVRNHYDNAKLIREFIKFIYHLEPHS